MDKETIELSLEDAGVETTEEEFRLFRDEAQRWVDLFQLRNIRWQVELGDTGDAYGTCHYGYACRTAFVTLTDSNLPDEGREALIKETALHEVLEAGLLGTLLLFAGDNRGISDETIEAEAHSVIYRLTNVLKGVQDGSF